MIDWTRLLAPEQLELDEAYRSLIERIEAFQRQDSAGDELVEVRVILTSSVDIDNLDPAAWSAIDRAVSQLVTDQHAVGYAYVRFFTPEERLAFDSPVEDEEEIDAEAR